MRVNPPATQRCHGAVSVFLLLVVAAVVLIHSRTAIAAERAGLPEAIDSRMRAIPAGQFQMGDTVGDGDPSEQPVRTVRIAGFRLSEVEVTRGQFAEFVRATGYRTDAERNVSGTGCRTLNTKTGEWKYRLGRNWREPGYNQTDQHPVVCVSWNDAQSLIDWLNRQTGLRFRLPSEAEWEYAARSGGADRYPWGPEPTQACHYANGADRTPWPPGSRVSWNLKLNCTDGHFFTAPVATHSPNIFGLADMIGNVWEWTADCGTASLAGAPVDGAARLTAECAGRVTRGGSWNSDPRVLRVTTRPNDAPWERDSDRGFRLARDP